MNANKFTFKVVEFKALYPKAKLPSELNGPSFPP